MIFLRRDEAVIKNTIEKKDLIKIIRVEKRNLNRKNFDKEGCFNYKEYGRDGNKYAVKRKVLIKNA